MSRPGEAIELDDFDADDEYIDDDDDEYEDTVGDITGAVGGQIRTPADRLSVRRRGSVEWETRRGANISSESRNSIQDLNDRLNLLKLRDDSDSPSLRKTIQTLQRQKAELARDEFRDYVLKEYGYTQQGTDFVLKANYFVDDSGRVKVKYGGKRAWLTKEISMEFYSLDSIAKQSKA